MQGDGESAHARDLYYSSHSLTTSPLLPSPPLLPRPLIRFAHCRSLAQIHTLAGKARGFPIESVGTLMDEPFTGLVYLEGSGITTDFRSIKGKTIGYVGEFGKIQVGAPSERARTMRRLP